MKCAKIKRLLSDYINNTLNSKTQLRVKNHLQDCPSCSQEILFLKKYFKEVKNIKKVEAPNDFLEKIHAKIDDSFSFKKWIKSIFIPIRFPLELAGAVVTIILIVVLFFPQFIIKEINQSIEKPLGPTVEIQKQMGMKEKPLKDKYKRELPLLSKKTIPQKREEPINITLNISSLPGAPEKLYQSESITRSKASQETISGYGALMKDEEKEADDKSLPSETIRLDRKRIQQVVDLSNSSRQIKDIIKNLKGIIITEQQLENQKNTQSLLFELPRTNYPAFILQINQQFQNQIQKPASLGPGDKLKKLKIQLNLQSE